MLRVTTLESRCIVVGNHMTSLESRWDKHMKATRRVEDVATDSPTSNLAEEASLFAEEPKPPPEASEPPATGSSLPPPAPAPVPAAPTQYCSGANVKDPIMPTVVIDPIRGLTQNYHGEHIYGDAAPWVDDWGRSLLHTPTGTPRRSTSPAPASLVEELVWGKTFQIFQHKLKEIERQQTATQTGIETASDLVRQMDFSQAEFDDRLDAIMKYTTRFEDDAKTTNGCARSSQYRSERTRVLAKSLGFLVSELESNSGPAAIPELTVPHVGAQPPASADAWMNLRTIRPNPLHGQRGPGSPHVAPGNLGVVQTAPNAFNPSIQIPQNNFSSPCGAIIHSEPLGQPLDTIPHDPFDPPNLKINVKDVGKDGAKLAQLPSTHGRSLVPILIVGNMWSLYEVGSSINVSHHQTHLPGTASHDSDDSNTVFRATVLPSARHSNITPRWHSGSWSIRNVAYLDAPVSMPVIPHRQSTVDGFTKTLEAGLADTLEHATRAERPAVRNTLRVPHEDACWQAVMPYAECQITTDGCAVRMCQMMHGSSVSSAKPFLIFSGAPFKCSMVQPQEDVEAPEDEPLGTIVGTDLRIPFVESSTGRARLRTSPTELTSAEIARHRFTHVPRCSVCWYCIASGRQNNQYRRQPAVR